MDCINIHGVPLEVYRENGVIVKVNFSVQCGKNNKALQREFIKAWKGEKNSLRYILDVDEKLKIIFHKVQEIPFGKVASYGDVSEAIFGNKNYSRLVGYAMKVNPLPIIIPCHRVVRSNGTLGGFGGGIQNKAKLLKAEGVKIENGRIAPVYFADL